MVFIMTGSLITFKTEQELRDKHKGIGIRGNVIIKELHNLTLECLNTWETGGYISEHEWTKLN